MNESSLHPDCCVGCAGNGQFHVESACESGFKPKNDHSTDMNASLTPILQNLNAMKRLALLALVVAGFSAGASAASYWNSANGDWNVDGNWWNGSATVIPTAADDVYIQSGGIGSPRVANIPSGYAAVCLGMFGPAWGDNEAASLNIASGGSLTVGGWFQMAHNGLNSLGAVTTAGTLTINGGLSTAYFGKSLFTVNGGSVYVAGQLEAAWNGMGRTTLQLNGGTMSIATIDFLRGPGYNEDNKIIDLAGGTLTLRDASNLGGYWLTKWIEDGNIVAYGGAGQVQQIVEGNTVTLSAVPEPASFSLLALGLLGVFCRRK
jgi:hypothetical protein